MITHKMKTNRTLKGLAHFIANSFSDTPEAQKKALEEEMERLDKEYEHILEKQ